MECPKCLKIMKEDIAVTHVSLHGHPHIVDSLTCMGCGESFVPVNGEPVPVEEYEALEGAPDVPLTEEDVDRMFEDGI